MPADEGGPPATLTMVNERQLTVVITGVTRGLGRAMAEAFARLGHAVCGRAAESIRSLREQLGSPHCATKWAIEGLTAALAQELPAGMAAVALNPGLIDTDMLRICFGTSASAYPPPAEWAQAAVPFLSRLGPADNGKTLTVPSVG